MASDKEILEAQSTSCCGSLFQAHRPLSDLKSAGLGNLGVVLDQGWMQKRGEGIPGIGTAFKKRWFLLFQDRILYYKEETKQASDSKPQGAIDLRGGQVTLVEPTPGQTIRFEIKVLDKSKQRIFTLACFTVEEQRRWHDALKSAVAGSVQNA